MPIRRLTARFTPLWLLVGAGAGLLTACLLLRCAAPAPPLARAVARAQAPPMAQLAAAEAPAYTYRLLPAAAGTFGYEIRRQGQPLLRQLTVPGRPGAAGFGTAAEAERVAALVARKLQRRLWPPAVTARELDSLRVAPALRP